jgi:hypothetical protein
MTQNFSHLVISFFVIIGYVLIERATLRTLEDQFLAPNFVIGLRSAKAPKEN